MEARGVERVPQGRVLLIANHAGNTFAWDGAMLSMAMFLEAEPPRFVRGMGEYFLPTLPFFNVMMHRMGSVVGRPENCARLLQQVREAARHVFLVLVLAAAARAGQPQHAVLADAFAQLEPQPGPLLLALLIRRDHGRHVGVLLMSR